MWFGHLLYDIQTVDCCYDEYCQQIYAVQQIYYFDLTSSHHQWNEHIITDDIFLMWKQLFNALILDQCHIVLPYLTKLIFETDK